MRTHITNPATAIFAENGEPQHATLCGQVLDLHFIGTVGDFYSTPRTAKFASQVTCKTCRKIAAARGVTLAEPQMVERRSAMDGTLFMEREDTPFYCSPSSESYWCN